MQHNTVKFIEKVTELAARFGFEISNETVGESVATVFVLKTDKAHLEIQITAKHCFVIDENQKQEIFKKSTIGWDKKSLEYIKKLLTAYTCLNMLQ